MTRVWKGQQRSKVGFKELDYRVNPLAGEDFPMKVGVILSALFKIATWARLNCVQSNPSRTRIWVGYFQFRWGLGLKLQIQFEFLLGWSWVWVWYVLKCNINLGLTWVKFGYGVKFCYDWLKVVFGLVRNLTQIQPSCTTSTINSYIVYFYQSALSYHGLTPGYLISQNCIRVW